MERSDGLWVALAVALWVALLLFFVQQGTLRFVFLATVLLLGMLLARRERSQRATKASWAGRDESEWAHIAAAVRKEQADRAELWLRDRLEHTREHEDAWVTRKNLARLLMSLGRLAEGQHNHGANPVGAE